MGSRKISFGPALPEWDQPSPQTTAAAKRRPFGLGPVVVATLAAVCSCHLLVDGELGTVVCNDLGAFGPPACPAGETCVGNVCTSVGLPWGHACDPAQDGCAPPARCFKDWLGPTDFGPLCTASCCVSADCGPARHGLVCNPHPAGTGNLCWPSALLDRPLPGDLPTGEACSTDADCRSAWCKSGTCRDTCCRDSHCGLSDAVCGLRNLRATAQAQLFWGCGPAGGPVLPAQPCTADADCKTGKCVLIQGQLQVCARPCCSSHECGALKVGDETFALACEPWGEPPVQLCARLVPLTASKDFGVICASDDECRSGRCISSAGAPARCADGCCVSTDCSGVFGASCEPVKESTVWTLQCVPR